MHVNNFKYQYEFPFKFAQMSLPFRFLVVLLAAIISHVYFRLREPSPFGFLSGLFLAQCAAIWAFNTIGGFSILRSIFEVSISSSIYLVTLVCCIAAYRLSPIHPLSGFPGPKAAILSKWWTVHRILARGGRHTNFQELHEKYGPWVRVGPNELSINVVPAIRSVYKLDRAPFYQGTPAKGDTLITIVDRKRHAERRQAWAKAVTNDALQQYILSAKRRSQELARHLSSSCDGGSQSVDLDKWINLFFMDLMGDMGFSGGFETMKAGKDPEGWMEMLAMGVTFVSGMGQVPWLRSVVQMLPQRGPIETFHKFTESKVKEIRENQALGKRRNDIFSILLDDSDGNPTLTPEDAAADAALIVVAATDTSVQTVLTFFRYVAADKECQKRIVDEIASVYPRLGSSAFLDVQSLLRLPYLDACIQESMRIIPPGPFGPPRTSGSEGTTIHGVEIPPNTTVHVPVYAMHRDPANFGPYADQFLPERWLHNKASNLVAGDEGDALLCNREAFVPFSTGYSSCIGKQLALQNIKIMIAEILNEFEVGLAPGFDARQYDNSFKEYGLWSHDPLRALLRPRC